MKRVMALDVGDKRTGAAISDELGITAQPLGVHQRTGYKSDLEWIRGFMKEYDIERLVVGLPLNMNGSRGERAMAAERYAEKLRADTGLEVSLWDERMTTMEAERFLIEAGMSRMKRKKKIDQTAASLILSGWLSANAWPKKKTGGVD